VTDASAAALTPQPCVSGQFWFPARGHLAGNYLAANVTADDRCAAALAALVCAGKGDDRRYGAVDGLHEVYGTRSRWRRWAGRPVVRWRRPSLAAAGTESGGRGARHGRSTLPFAPVVVDLAAPVPVLAACARYLRAPRSSSR
jgi:hypothetical protein